MHSYGIDSTERRDVPFYLAIMASGLTIGLRSLLGRYGLQPGAVAYVPSGFALYGLLHVLFDQFIWRIQLLRLTGIVRAPLLDGDWSGMLRSSASGYANALNVKLRIHQTWSTIRLTLESDNSFSSSNMAAIRAISAGQFELRWEYRAEAKDPAQGVRFNHRGVTMLRFEIKKGVVCPEMNGDYYTHHGRDTNGSITATRVNT
jgi:hypothetical protein